LLYGIRNNVAKKWFNIRCKDILSTPPIRPSKSNLKIVSFIHPTHVLMSIIAIKSLYYYLKEGQVVILSDNTFTSKDIKTLKYHLSPSEIVDIDGINIGKCPPGNTWERLCFIAHCVKNHYVIQADADTIAIGEIPEVQKCVRENRSFTLGSPSGQKISPMKDTCEMAKLSQNTRVQMVSEKNFDKLINYNQLKYVRGSSGFAGFAKGSFSLEELEKFSQEMQENIGYAKWSEYGSESLASSYIVANSPSACVLPYPKYASYYTNRKVDYEKSSFIHLIGTERFAKGFYQKVARGMIKKIRNT